MRSNKTNHITQTGLAWEISQPEREFGSWLAEQFRQVTPKLNSTKHHYLSSNLTSRTWQVTLLSTTLAWKQEFGSYRAMHFRQVHQNWIPKNITSFAQIQRLEPDKLIFCEPLLTGRYHNQNKSLEALGRSVSVNLRQYLDTKNLINFQLSAI